MISPREDPTRSSGSETRDALADVLKDQAERSERYSAKRAPKEKTDAPARAIIAVLIPLTIWMWLAPPALLRPTPVEPPPRITAAGATMDLYVVALQVNDFLAANGRLPARLTDALEEGDDGNGVVYEALGPSDYRLSVVRGDQTTSYMSGDDLMALVRQARPVLGGN